MIASQTQYVTVSILDVPRSGWVERGACSRAGSPFLAAKEDVEVLRTVCAACPVQELCLAYAIANEEKFGVWGGMTPSERRKHKDKIDVSRVPVEFRDHYLKMEGRVKRNQSTPHYVRNPDLDLVIDPDFLAFIDAG